MNQIFKISTSVFMEAITPLLVFLITLISGYAIRRIVFLRLGQWAKNTKTQLYNIIIAALKGPFSIWFL